MCDSLCIGVHRLIAHVRSLGDATDCLWLQLQLTFGLCGMPTEETWPGFFKLQGAKAIELEDKYVHRLRDRFKKYVLSLSLASRMRSHALTRLRRLRLQLPAAHGRSAREDADARPSEAHLGR